VAKPVALELDFLPCRTFKADFDAAEATSLTPKSMTRSRRDRDWACQITRLV
jgi:hypothetical protein